METKHASDMLVKLYNIKDIRPALLQQMEQGVTIRKVLAGEKHLVTNWIRKHFTDSWASEAEIVREVVRKGGYQSIIIVTSPFHSRRAWVTYRKVFEDMDTQIRMRCSIYSSYNPEEWWKSRRYLRTVAIEYQKFGYYIFKYLF